MRNATFIICILVACLPLHAESHSLCAMTDICVMDGVWEDTLQSQTVVRVSLDEQFFLSLPLSITCEKGRGNPRLLETGLMLDYYPLSCGLHLSLSLVEVGFLFNDWYGDEEDAKKFLNELAVGWSITPWRGLCVEPRITFRDPNGMFQDAYNALSLRFSRFPMTRFSLLVGWSFSLDQRVDNDDQEEEKRWY